MLEFLSQVINGLAIGNVYAVIALGFVLVFGVAKVVNFAQGSQVMLSAYVAWTAATVWGLPLPLAFLVSLIVSIGVAWVLELIAVEWLGQSAEIAPLLSTLAIALIIDQAAILFWSADPVPFPNPLAGTNFHFGSFFVSGTDIAILAVSITFMVGLVLFLKKTWLGRSIRASAQDPAAAAQMGVRTRQAKMAAFAISGVVGAVGGVLVGMYFQQIDPTMGLPFGLKGFAAAMLGGVTSLPGAVVGGLLIGVLESLSSAYIGPEFRDLIAFALLLVVLVVRPRGLLGSKSLEGLGGSRGAGAIPTTSPLANGDGEPVALIKARNTKLRWTFVTVGVLALLCVIIPSSYWVSVIAQSAIFATAALGLVVLIGIAGQVSIGHAALMGIGAYTTAKLTTENGWPFELTLIAVLVMGVISGAVFALPIIRLTGHTVALASLALGQIGYLVFLNAIPVTRGPNGIPAIPAPKFALLGGWELTSVTSIGVFCCAILAFALVLYGLFNRGQISINLRAIREDRLAAEASGIPARAYLITAYIFSGVMASLAGLAFTYQQSFVSPDSFLIQLSFLLLTMVLVGGIISAQGAIIGAVILTALPEVLREVSDYRMIIYGLVLLLLVKYLPAGVTSIGKRARRTRPDDATTPTPTPSAVEA